MVSNMTGNDSDYDYDTLIIEKEEKETYLNEIRMMYMIVYAICSALSLTLNIYAVILSCRKIQEHSTSVWVLALAFTHLVFSVFLVPQVFYAWNFFNWHLGAALCKISSYIFYASMFSTASLLSLWSVSDSMGDNGCWDRFHNKCCNNGRFTIIVLLLISWMYGAVLSSPSLLSRELRQTELGQQCIDNYGFDKERLITVVLSRFLLGVLVPMAVMTISACVAGRQRHIQNKTYKQITCAIKVTYFVSWTPLLFLGLIQATTKSSFFFKHGLPTATVMASIHCFINPVIYLLVGSKDMSWMSHSISGVV